MSLQKQTNSLILRIGSFANDEKHFNADMMSLSLTGSTLKRMNIDKDIKVTLIFKHAREAKGPTYALVSHELYADEKPTAIYGTAKCVFWNSAKELCATNIDFF